MSAQACVFLTKRKHLKESSEKPLKVAKKTTKKATKKDAKTGKRDLVIIVRRCGITSKAKHQKYLEKDIKLLPPTDILKTFLNQTRCRY